MSVVTDPIADMLSRISNGYNARRTSVDVPKSKMKMAIARILHEEGYLRGFQLVNHGRDLRLRLKYDEFNQPIIGGCRRVSKPGRRVYKTRAELPRVLGGMGIAIVSTSQGVMSAKRARQAGTGGEVICELW